MSKDDIVSRYEKAKEKKEQYTNELIRLKTTKDNYRQRLNELIAKAKDEYIKDDNIKDEEVIGKLRELFYSMTKENEEKLSKYEKKVDYLASQIEQVKRNANIK